MKKIIITGAAQGIGLAMIKKFKHLGWLTIGLDVIDHMSECDHYFKVNVSKKNEVQNVYQGLSNLGIPTINALVNNAAIQIEKSLFEYSEDDWDRVINTNLKSVFLMTQTFAPIMRNGSIINISSVHARATSPGMAPYVASKGGVSALTRALATELGSIGIRVNAILPGAVDTKMLQQGLNRSQDIKSAREKLKSASPLKKIGTPDEIACLASFLADSDLAGNITGQEFVCDSGILSRLASE